MLVLELKISGHFSMPFQMDFCKNSKLMVLLILLVESTAHEAWSILEVLINLYSPLQ